jgi:hypothetical protein
MSFVRAHHFRPCPTPCIFEKSVTWAENYAKEERKGMALLQRIRRLESDRAEILESKGGINESLATGSRLYVIDEELLNTRQLYSAHRERFRQLWSTKPRSSFAANLEMGWKPQYTMHDRSWLWRKQVDVCIMTGGCCGRDCGCCKKPLMIVPSRKKRALYSHCTAECGCCAKNHGSYTPDPSIKKS